MLELSIDSIPFELAPTSRPNSPSIIDLNCSFYKRLVKSNLERRKTGSLIHDEGLNGRIIPPFLSSTIKGSLDKNGLNSPWSSKVEEEELILEGRWNQDLPINMEEWDEWEVEKVKLREKSKKAKGKDREMEVDTLISADKNLVFKPSDYPPTPTSVDSDNLLPVYISADVKQSQQPRRSQSGIIESRGPTGRKNASNNLTSTGEPLTLHQSVPTILPSSANHASPFKSNNPQVQQKQQTFITSTLTKTKPFVTHSFSKTHPTSLHRVNSKPLNINSSSPPKSTSPKHKKAKKAKKSNQSYQDVSSSSFPQPEVLDLNTKVVSTSLSQFISDESHSLPTLSSSKPIFRDPFLGASPIKSMSWRKSNGSNDISGGEKISMLEDELLGEGGNSEFMLTDSPTKPFQPFSSNLSTSNALPPTFPLPLSDPSLLNQLPLNTSTPNLIPVVVLISNISPRLSNGNNSTDDVGGDGGEAASNSLNRGKLSRASRESSEPDLSQVVDDISSFLEKDAA